MSIVTIPPYEFEPFLSTTTIADRIDQISTSMSLNESENNPVFLVVMTGAFIFAADLLRKISFPCEVRFVRVKSYAGTSSTGVFRIERDYLDELSGRNIIIIEDIIDTGKTIEKIVGILSGESVSSIKICTLLSKPDAHEVPIHIDYVGFEIPNEFVIGYGLDYNDKGRNLPEILKVKR